jgi:hypothetical protein
MTYLIKSFSIANQTVANNVSIVECLYVIQVYVPQSNVLICITINYNEIVHK